MAKTEFNMVYFKHRRYTFHAE